MVPGALGLRQLVLQHLRVLHHGLSFQGGVLGIVQKEDGGQRGGKFKFDKKNRYLTMEDPFLIGAGGRVSGRFGKRLRADSVPLFYRFT